MALPIAPDQYSKREETENRRQIDQRISQVENRPIPEPDPIVELNHEDAGVMYDFSTSGTETINRSRRGSSWSISLLNNATSVSFDTFSVSGSYFGTSGGSDTIRFSTSVSRIRSAAVGTTLSSDTARFRADVSAPINPPDYVSFNVGYRLVKSSSTTISIQQGDTTAGVSASGGSTTMRWTESRAATVNTNFANLVDISVNIHSTNNGELILSFINSNGIWIQHITTQAKFRALTAQTEGTMVNNTNMTKANSIKFMIDATNYVAFCRDSSNNVLAGISNWSNSSYPRPDFDVDQVTVQTS